MSGLCEASLSKYDLCEASLSKYDLHKKSDPSWRQQKLNDPTATASATVTISATQFIFKIEKVEVR